MQKYSEGIQLILDNFKDFIDKPLIYEKLAYLGLKANKLNITEEYALLALQRNSENLSYYLYYFNAKGIQEPLEKMTDLVNFSESDKKLSLQLLRELKEKKIKSRISERIELALIDGEEFKEKIANYIALNIKQTNPSILNAIKVIYDHQKEKIGVINEILLSHIKSIETNDCLAPEYTNTEKLDILTYFGWVYYFAALHFDYLRELEKALYYINLAIDPTPSVVEFFTLKSKILKHGGMLKESAEAYDKVRMNFNSVIIKARKLDLGDRYLNAKYAKCFLRNDQLDKAAKTTEEFTKNPISNDHIDYLQCLWYEIESSYAYLKTNKIGRAFIIYYHVIGHFTQYIEDHVYNKLILV